MTLFINHVVITVNDINLSVDFYINILGMELNKLTSASDNIIRKSLKFGKQLINLHENLKPFEPHASNLTPGSMDICFVSMKSIDQWIKIFKNSQIQIEEGPVMKTGANGPIKSIYIRDPDNNLIESSNEI